MTILVECERYFKARQESQKIVWEDDRTTIRKYCDNIKIYETKSILGDFFLDNQDRNFIDSSKYYKFSKKKKKK